jgi:hypothetical protein
MTQTNSEQTGVVPATSVAEAGSVAQNRVIVYVVVPIVVLGSIFFGLLVSGLNAHRDQTTPNVAHKHYHRHG